MTKGKSIRADEKKGRVNAWPVPKTEGNNIFMAINENQGACALTMLSRRERQVLELIAQGLTTKDIARLRVLHAGTIEKYRLNIINKNKVHNMCEAVAMAIRAGFIK
jgi:DNA-binding NarL/FixJ family response regulator